MMFKNFVVVCALLATSALAAGLSAARIAPGQGALPFPVGDLKFNGTIGGHAVNLTGNNVLHILDQAEALFPSIDRNALISHAAANLTIRGVDNKADIDCMGAEADWGVCSWTPLWNGVVFLDLLNGYCGVAAQSCTFLYCQGGCAEILCNQNTDDLVSPCNYLASYIEDIAAACVQDVDGDFYAKGIEFDTAGMQVEAREYLC